ncbi:MAG: BrnT family toxin [SAR324 cluster bacterium]|nr:BrnT family toxin [SAR324 cluster bacterium]
MFYNFEWHSIKAKKNLQKHKINFERASQIFLDPIALSIPDEEHSLEEERWITIGKDQQGLILVAIHTFRRIDENTCVIGLISARKATKRELQQYYEGI